MQKARWLSKGPHPTPKLLYGTIKRFSIPPSSSITDDAIPPSRARSPHGYVKNTVLMSSGANNPRLNRVGDAFFPQAAAWAGPGEKLQISPLCGPNPQEDDEVSELTRDRA